jgi:hypothetical protein
MEIKVKFRVRTNRVGSDVSEVLIVDVEDEATQKDIEDACEEVGLDWVHNNIVWNYVLTD